MTDAFANYLAHSANEHDKVGLLNSHLQNVANRAAEYAEAFGAAEEARLAGLLHDLGKYGDLFQKRLHGKERGIDHWSVGAWHALTEYKLVASAMAIQGHHIGLQQASADALKGLNPTKLQGYHPLGLRLSETKVDVLLNNYKADGLSLPSAREPFSSVYEGLQAPCAASMLDVRMLFSALVDADFVETEAHFQGNPDGSKCYREAGSPLQSEQAMPHLMSYLEELGRQSKASPHVNRLRADLLKACLEAGSLPQGLFTLTAPTGTGKTLSMLAFALNHAAKHELRRIVMVIPYLSIIEQTVKEYRKVFEPYFGSEYILEHHSLAGIHADKKTSVRKGSDMDGEAIHHERLLAENWDAPIIITTSVQLLESLFADRPAACRKLHRLAKSVILFDEVQTLPVSLAVPTLSTLSRLAERYSTTVVFSTATQPAFRHLDIHVKKYCAGGWSPREIVSPNTSLFERAKRTRVKRPDISLNISWRELAKELSLYDSALCVVNLKRHALCLYEELEKLGVKWLFHLSTNMCPAHRHDVLEELHRRLEYGEPCHLVSTQCIEAGVDVDFPVVYRALGPLDAIAQAAGRCNRNGHMETSIVHIFLPEEERYPDGAYGQATDVTRSILQKHKTPEIDIHSSALFKEYYEELYDLVRPENKKRELNEGMQRRDFSEVARFYRVIDQNAINILVPYDLEIFHRLSKEVRDVGLNRRWIARARPYTIGLFNPRHDTPVMRYLEKIPIGRAYSDEWFVYLNEEHYHPQKGLVPPSSLEVLIA